jgi:hypothetical protein
VTVEDQTKFIEAKEAKNVIDLHPQSKLGTVTGFEETRETKDGGRRKWLSCLQEVQGYLILAARMVIRPLGIFLAFEACGVCPSIMVSDRPVHTPRLTRATSAGIVAYVSSGYILLELSSILQIPPLVLLRPLSRLRTKRQSGHLRRAPSKIAGPAKTFALSNFPALG